MGADSFTGVVVCTFKRHNSTSTVYKYTIIEGQCPENYYKNIEKFKNIYDLNNLTWTTSKSKIYEIANGNELVYPTQHGIISLDYTREETLEYKIMYTSEYNKLITIKNILCVGFDFILNIIYLLFIIKLYMNLYH